MHSLVLVVAPADTPDDIGAAEQAIRSLMDPFSDSSWYDGHDEDEERPSGPWWDWWRFGGRWNGVLHGDDSKQQHYAAGGDDDPAYNIVHVKDIPEKVAAAAVFVDGAMTHHPDEWAHGWWIGPLTDPAYANRWVAAVDVH